MIEIHRRIAFACVLVLTAMSLVTASGCDRKDESPKAEEVVSEPPPGFEEATLTARQHVVDGVRRSVASALRKVELQYRRDGSADVPADVVENARTATILFSANNHGEREDCGCKANPLGGLTRRDTLIDLARDPSQKSATKWWGEKAASGTTIFVADAGDLLFKNATIDRAPEHVGETAKIDARAIVEALNHNPPDVFNVGELDLALGTEVLDDLEKRAKFPFISANLRTADGEPKYRGHRVVERGGMTVAFIGLTKDQARLKDFYDKRGLSVVPAAKAYRDEVKKLPKDVDLVVMLSNLGNRKTKKLVEGLADSGERVDIVLVSNSNRLTAQPDWVAGVPIVEPLSRGKYFGRLDVYLQGDTIEFQNASANPLEATRQYRRAWSSYVSTRKQLAQLQRQIADLRERIGEEDAKGPKREGKKPAASKEEGAAAKNPASPGKPSKEDPEFKMRSRLEFLEKKLDVLQKRVRVSSEAINRAAAKINEVMETSEKGPSGDDWLVTNIAQVKLEIEEDPKVRRVLDRWEKKRPEAPKRKRPAKRRLRKRDGDHRK